MRLLRYEESDDQFSLTEDLSKENIPPYAILSHTWGLDTDEVTWKDVEDGVGKEKAGYQKLRFCAKQAKHNGLRHFWIDTCCINKSNKAELTYAINSMFHWYGNAVRCYVYLSDVSAPHYAQNSPPPSRAWESAFRSSRWFERGWTLQELLAPSQVEFFSSEGTLLGSKDSLKDLIHEITGIPVAALRGESLMNFDVEERFTWAKDRKTSREVDKAYSLLGIFGVYIAPDYDETKRDAMDRLRTAIDTSKKYLRVLCNTDPRDDKRRIEEDKGGLLDDVYHWVLANDALAQWRQAKQSSLLWIKGDPGKGKTMLLCGIINELERNGGALSYFFCQAADNHLNNATVALRGLIYMLVVRQPSLLPHVQKKYEQVGRQLFEGANAWVAVRQLFLDILHDPALQTPCLVIDALDECQTGRRELLDLIVSTRTAYRVKWLVSSRNWSDIGEKLTQAALPLSLELNAKSVSAAVQLYIQHKACSLAEEKSYDVQTTAEVTSYLSAHARDTFLWVALVCRVLAKVHRFKALKTLKGFPAGLDALYLRMLGRIRSLDDSDDVDLCWQILAITCTVYRPVSLDELSSLLDWPDGLVTSSQADASLLTYYVELCGTFLTIRENTVFLIHQSVKDFIWNPALNHTFPQIFLNKIGGIHDRLFTKSVFLLSRTLQRNIYQLPHPGIAIGEISTPNRDPLAALRYSCIYWADHLCDAISSTGGTMNNSRDGGTVYIFLQEKYLYWVEALSLLNSISEGVIVARNLQDLPTADKELISLTKDAYRFILYNRSIIEQAPLQTYISALLFTPSRSIIRQLFFKEEPKWINQKPVIEDNWSACLSTLEGHNGQVNSVSFSLDGQQIVSGSDDKTIKIWDRQSGACLSTLEGHSGWVRSVGFSLDGQQIVSGSDDTTIKIWDRQSDACLSTLEGHSDWVNSVGFLSDGQQIVSSSSDKTIKIWDRQSGACLSTLEGHNDWVNSVGFSLDGQKIVSGSDDMTIKIWDRQIGACLSTLEGHSGWVRSVGFSPDGQQIVSGSYDMTIKIWDRQSGACLSTLKGHSGWVNSVGFSPDGQQIVSGSYDTTIKIWDQKSGACLSTLEGHNGQVNSVSFSLDGQQIVSVSDDKTIKIWDRQSGACLSTLEGHNDWVRSVGFSPDGQKIVSGSDDTTIKIWDRQSGACLSTLEGHSGQVNSVSFSLDGQKIVSVSDDTTIKIWDQRSGACLSTLEGHSGQVNSVGVSLDGQQIISGSYDKTIKIWDQRSGACLSTLKGHSGSVRSVGFSPDGQKIVSGSYDKTIKIWDQQSGACLSTFKGHNGSVHSVGFSPDGQQIVSGSYDKTIKIWDRQSGACLSTFKGHSGSVSSVASTTGYEETWDIDQSWITWKGQNLLWLPSGFRPTTFAIHSNMLAIGCASGLVWNVQFSLTELLQFYN